MLYEYRRYEAVPGKMPALHRRFAEVTTRIFERHGIHPIGFWEAIVGTSNELHYILQWDDLAQRERSWVAFQEDPEWQAARAQSEADGPLVARTHSYLWRPTPYSPLK